MSTPGLRVCEVSHFFCYAGYRQKAAAMARLTGQRELLLVPAGWTEDFHGTRIEPEGSEEYILLQRRAYLNWKLWGPKRFQLFVLTPRIVQDIHGYRPDIIVVDSEPFGLLAFEVALIRHLFFPRCRLIVHSSQTLYKRYPVPFNLTEAFVLSNATAFFARTEGIKHILLRKGCTRPIYIVPHGVDADRFSPAASDRHDPAAAHSALRIGYAGALARHKGAHLLIEAAGKLQVPFELRIAGDGPQRRALQADATGLPAASRISFHGSIPNAQLPQFLRALDVLVVPSITMSNWNEQFGRIIIEAMACGVPVIGSTCGSIPEVVGDGGVVFPERDAEELRKRLEQLATDRQQLHDLSLRARQRVLDNYSWESVAQKVFQIYRNLLAPDVV